MLNFESHHSMVLGVEQQCGGCDHVGKDRHIHLRMSHWLCWVDVH